MAGKLKFSQAQKQGARSRAVLSEVSRVPRGCWVAAVPSDHRITEYPGAGRDPQHPPAPGPAQTPSHPTEGLVQGGLEQGTLCGERPGTL